MNREEATLRDIGLGPKERKPSSTPGFTFLWILIGCYTVGFIGAEASMRGLGGWYEAITKPSWAPPNWAFSPIWTVLYGCLSVACWMVFRETGYPSRRPALILFWIQLVVNGLWPFFFFMWHRLVFGLIDLVVLDLLLVVCLLVMRLVRGSSALLMLPYLAWSIFATVLNLVMWKLNR